MWLSSRLLNSGTVRWLQRAPMGRTLVELANRDRLPGSKSSPFPQYLSEPRENFPVLIEAEKLGLSANMNASELADAVKANFQSTLNEHGAVLYRGFNALRDYKAFATFFGALADFEAMEYIGGAAPRKLVGDGVYTASDEPPELSIEPHNEMAYMHIWPDVLMFYCDTPPAPGCGGQTVIVNVRDIAQNLDPAVLEKFKELGVYYSYHWVDENTVKGYKSWQEVFVTKDRSDVEEYLAKNDIEWEWQSDGSLEFGYKRPAFTTYPATGETLWFNHAHRKHASYWKYNHPFWDQFKELPYHKFPSHTYYGDKSEIPEDVIQHIRDVTWRAAVGFQMQKHDIIAIENHLVMHARLSFTGERRLLATLLQYNK